MLKNDFLKLIPGAVLCDVPDDILDVLQVYFNKLTLTRPNITEGKYKQWFIQHALHGNHLRDDDTNFTVWQDYGKLDKFKEFFLQFVNGIYRFRYCSMPANHLIDYHRPHLYPRIHIPLNDSKSFFTIDTPDKTFEFTLEKGKAYILNVVWPHTVKCDLYREHCFFSFSDFATNDLKSKYWLD